MSDVSAPSSRGGFEGRFDSSKEAETSARVQALLERSGALVPAATAVALPIGSA